MTALAVSPEARPRMSPAAWSAAACLALALHLALGLAAAWALRADEADDEAGAPAIELAMESAAPRGEQTDMPIGPEADASAASPESAQSVEKTEAMDRPKDEAQEIENADRLVTTEDAKKAEKEPEKPQQKPSEASAVSAASEAAAAPRVEDGKTDDKATAPVLGAGRAAQQALVSWQKRLLAHLNRNKRYPAGARAQQAENKVVFTIDRLGHVVDARISASSGEAGFDEAALDMMRRADPVPPPPPVVADHSLTYEVPVVFRAPKAR